MGRGGGGGGTVLGGAIAGGWISPVGGSGGGGGGGGGGGKTIVNGEGGAISVSLANSVSPFSPKFNACDIICEAGEVGDIAGKLSIDFGRE